MCTLLVLHRVHPTFPVVIAGNRDEAYARDTGPPRVLRNAPRIVGGLDREQGGTWLGLTPEGITAAITNQRSWFTPGPAPRSRGEVVLETLAAASRAPPGERGAAVREHLSSMDARAQNSFNLLVAGPESLQVAYARRESNTIEIESLPEGLHVLANDRLHSPAFPKLDRARALIEPHARKPWDALVGHLKDALSDHALPPREDIQEPPQGARSSRETARTLQAICIHTPTYGTRSTSLVALRAEGVAHYLYADGPPCEAPFSDYTQLLSS